MSSLIRLPSKRFSRRSKRRSFPLFISGRPGVPIVRPNSKNGGWLKMVKDNPQVKFYFVSVWNDDGDGKSLLAKFQIADQPNVTILADPGPRRGDAKIKQFAGMPLSWIPTTWVYKGGDLRYALSYGEVRFPVLQQFLKDTKSEGSHNRDLHDPPPPPCAAFLVA